MSDRDALAVLLRARGVIYPENAAAVAVDGGWRPPAHEISDPAELAALPVGTVGIAPTGMAWQRWRDRWTAKGSTCTSEFLAAHRGPLTIVYVPTEETS